MPNLVRLFCTNKSQPIKKYKFFIAHCLLIGLSLATNHNDRIIFLSDIRKESKEFEPEMGFPVAGNYES